MTNSPTTVSAVQDSAERRRQWFEDAPIAYHEIDTDGVILDVNRAKCQLLGYSPEELIGRHIWDFVAADQRQACRDAITKKVDRQQPGSILTREYRRSDGSYVWLEIREKLIENVQGEVIGILSALIDITERLKLESEIRNQLDWMRFVFRSTSKAVITTDALGNISLMNPAAETLTGHGESDGLGRPLEQICRLHCGCGEPIDLMSCILAEPVHSKRLRNFTLIDSSDARHSVTLTTSPILNDCDVIIGAMLVVENMIQ